MWNPYDKIYIQNVLQENQQTYQQVSLNTYQPTHKWLFNDVSLVLVGFSSFSNPKEPNVASESQK